LINQPRRYEEHEVFGLGFLHGVIAYGTCMK